MSQPRASARRYSSAVGISRISTPGTFCLMNRSPIEMNRFPPRRNSVFGLLEPQ